MPSLPRPIECRSAKIGCEHGTLSPLALFHAGIIAPLTARGNMKYRAMTVPELTAEMFDAKVNFAIS